MRAPAFAICSAAALPIPDPAPVTSATLPASSIVNVSSGALWLGQPDGPCMSSPKWSEGDPDKLGRVRLRVVAAWGDLSDLPAFVSGHERGRGGGDLNGITARLDHLAWLGVDALWVSPIYPSPMADFGYDVADYCAIDPLFGTMADFDRLVAQAHQRGLKVILDFVPNHTSDQHPWFVESRSSQDNPKRDWYLWRDPKPDGAPPNNWLSEFGGPAWTLDQTTGQYYYHAYLSQQPDLNWRNPEVQAAMLDVLRFWLERGVDGFRVDVLWQMIKDVQFRDNPPNPDYLPGHKPHTALRPIYTV